MSYYSLYPYGKMHIDYLKASKPVLYHDLEKGNHLTGYAEYVNRHAKDQMEELIVEMTEMEGVTEELKARDQMLWVAKMNSIHARAEEIVLSEWVFN